MVYPVEYGFHAHRNCANFRDGLCTLSGVAVDPNGPACPNFTPKIIGAKPQAARAYPEARQLYKPYAPQTIQGYSLDDYRPRYGFGCGSSAPNAPMQGGAGFALASPRAGGRGGMGGFRAGGDGRGRGRMGGVAAGPGGSCVCPNCGYTTSHVVGTPCYQQTCPRCGSKMTRRSQ